MIATLNDQFRRNSMADIYFAGELAQLDPFEMAAILGRIRCFDKFENDEHDFMSFTFGDRTVFAKIDYLTPDLKAGLDPLDPECRRVMTIFFAEDY